MIVNRNSDMIFCCESSYLFVYSDMDICRSYRPYRSYQASGG